MGEGVDAALKALAENKRLRTTLGRLQKVFGEAQESLDSLETAIACHVRDWSTEHRDAWIWGIVLGWDKESMDELTKEHGWKANTVARLISLRRAFKALKQGEI